MHRLLVIGATSLAALVLSGSAAGWSWPADGDVLRPFALGTDAYAAGQHRGIDVAGPTGSSIRAPASGTVSFAGSLPTYGRSVTIVTADGYAVTLLHLGTVEVAKGDAVEEGSPVATMGSSGEPEHPAPSVHMGVRIASQEEGYVDPLGLLPPRATAPRQQAPAPPLPVATAPPVPAAAAAPPGAAAASSPATAPAVAAAPAAPGTSGSPTPPVAAAQAAQVSRAGSASPASSAPGTSAPSQPASAPGPVSAAPDLFSTAAGSTSTAESGEFVVSAPAHRVRQAGGVQPASRTMGMAAHAAGRVVGASTVPDAVAHPGVRVDRRIRVREARVERPVGEGITAPETTRPRPHAAAAAHGRGRHAQIAETAVTRGEKARDRGKPVGFSERATPAAGLPRATTPEDAAAMSEPRPAGGPSPAVLAAVALLVLLSAGIVTKAARRIARDGPVLRHHADLLRELHAAHRARVHDRGGGRLHAPSTATRS